MLSLTDQKKQAVGYKCPTLIACKHLWKCAVEQQYFYTYCVVPSLYLSRVVSVLFLCFLFFSVVSAQHVSLSGKIMDSVALGSNSV